MKFKKNKIRETKEQNIGVKGKKNEKHETEEVEKGINKFVYGGQL